MMSIASVLEDPAASTWLKSALGEALDRDHIEATKDAEDLCKLLTARLDHARRERRLDALLQRFGPWGFAAPSIWFLSVAGKALDRDPVDAVNDAEVLRDILLERHE